MKILAVETSCDDTCVAVVEIQDLEKDLETKILSNVISSQVKIHAKYGGIYPSLAKREHQKNLPIALRKALRTAKNPKVDPVVKFGKNSVPLVSPSAKHSKFYYGVDLIAVTVGPGLEPCLWVGVNFAKDLAKKLNLPIVPVNHIEAHILANWLTPIGSNSKLFPAICLVVSGGHTQLILMKGFGKYKILGETRDDAAGECFDKAARILGLGYPGGPIVAKTAKKINRYPTSVNLPRPMIYQKNYDFSFSGLKTAVLYLVKQLTADNKQLTVKQVRRICAEVQQAIIDVLIHKTLKAAKEYKTKAIILGGGVAANEELRKQFKQRCANLKFKHLVPPKNLCTDNAAMVAVAGYLHRQEKRKPENGEEDKSSSSPTELPVMEAKVKMGTKFPSPFAGARVGDELRSSSPFAGARVIEADANLRL